MANNLVASLNNLAKVYATTDRASLAEPVLKQAVTHAERIAREAPQESEYQNSLAASYGNLAGMCVLLERFDEASTLYEKALPVREALVGRHPAVLTYRLLLSSTACNLGELHLRRDQAPRSLPWFDKALATLNRILEQEPRHGTARYYCSYTYAWRARAHEVLGNNSQAIADLDQAIRLDDRNDASLRSRRDALVAPPPPERSPGG